MIWYLTNNKFFSKLKNIGTNITFMLIKNVWTLIKFDINTFFFEQSLSHMNYIIAVDY